jgi:hypothetical protein
MWLALSPDPRKLITAVSALGQQTVKVIGPRYATVRPTVKNEDVSLYGC